MGSHKSHWALMASFLYYIIVFGVFALPIPSIAALGTKYQPIKETHIHFYWQEKIGGTNPTTIKVVQGQDPTNIFSFGDFFVGNLNLTKNPSRSSKVIGHVQGTATIVSQTQDINQTIFQLSVNIAFNQGIYNESTIAIFGLNSIAKEVRQLSIVGGTGTFKGARGFILLRTILFSINTGDVTQEANACIYHY